MQNQSTEFQRDPPRGPGRRKTAVRIQRLRMMLEGDEASLTDVVKVLRSDSSLSRWVLEEASERQEGEAAPVYHLKRAVQLLGFRRVRSIIASLATAV